MEFRKYLMEIGALATAPSFIASKGKPDLQWTVEDALSLSPSEATVEELKKFDPDQRLIEIWHLLSLACKKEIHPVVKWQPKPPGAGEDHSEEI